MPLNKETETITFDCYRMVLESEIGNSNIPYCSEKRHEGLSVIRRIYSW